MTLTYTLQIKFKLFDLVEFLDSITFCKKLQVFRRIIFVIFMRLMDLITVDIKHNYFVGWWLSISMR